MYQELDEREISIKDIIIYALRHWRRMLILGIVVGVLLGAGYALNALRNWDNNVTEYSDALEVYTEEQENYEARKEQLETEVEDYLNSIESQQKYMQESVLMNMNAHNKMQASADVVVKIEDSVLAESDSNVNYHPTDSVVMLYANGIETESDWQKIADASGVDLDYIKELVSVEADLDSNIFTITVSHPEEETAMLILNEVLDEMKTRESSITAATKAHTVSIVNTTAGKVNDEDLLLLQTEAKERMATDNQTMAARETELNALTEPTLATGEPSVNSMVVKTIIFVILGLIVGACIVACWYCVVFICDGKIHSEEELKDLNLIRSLGAFPQETKGQAFVDKWLDKLAGVDKNKTAAQAEQLIVLNIQNYAGEAKNILVTGSASEEELARVQKVLADGLAGATVSVGKDAESNVESYKKAVASDAVVFVEKQGSSKYIELLKDKQFAESLGKEIAGCVLL